MSYKQNGRILINGNVDPGEVNDDKNDLTVRPEDDGLQIVDYTTGDFEWWYFDMNDPATGYFLKIVLHIGTDPLKTRIISQLAISVNTTEGNDSLFLPFDLSELKADTRQCNLSVSDKIKIWAEPDELPEYFIKINIPRFKCNIRFRGGIEGWKPFGNKIVYQTGKKKGDFSWVIPMPKASVDGDFFYENINYTLSGASGYHDHNYIKPDRKQPLYLDNLANKWYWGKCYVDRFTLIFAFIFSGATRRSSVMVASDNKIIHNSNVLTDCSVINYGYDNILKTKYPESLRIRSLDDNFPFQADFEFEKILDRKDLLDGVNPLLKFLIRKLIAKPAYHGIFCKVRFEIHNTCVEGYGNFESMVFRGK